MYKPGHWHIDLILLNLNIKLFVTIITELADVNHKQVQFILTIWVIIKFLMMHIYRLSLPIPNLFYA